MLPPEEIPISSATYACSRVRASQGNALLQPVLSNVDINSARLRDIAVSRNLALMFKAKTAKTWKDGCMTTTKQRYFRLPLDSYALRICVKEFGPLLGSELIKGARRSRPPHCHSTLRQANFVFRVATAHSSKNKDEQVSGNLSEN